MGESSGFNFWEEKVPVDQLNCIASSGNAMEIQIQHHIEDQYSTYSPPLWKQAPTGYRRKSLPFLQNYHHYRCPSPSSRLRAVSDGRREIMEMVKDIPESSYELSLKDIVDNQQSMEELQEKKLHSVEEKKVKQKKETRIPQKSRNTKGSHICRTESIESEALQLKMFVPVPLSSRKKSTAKKSTRICRGPLLDGSEKRAATDWWKMISLAVKGYRKFTNMNIRSSDISNNKTSLVGSTLIPCEWSDSKKKCKPRGHKGCLF